MDATSQVGIVRLITLTTVAIAVLAAVRRPVAPRRLLETTDGRRRRVIDTAFGDGGRRPRATSLPDALDAMCRFLRAGHSVPAALAAAAGECCGPIAVQWSDLVASVSSGADLGDAVRAWGARSSGHRSVTKSRRRRATPSRSDEALAAAAISIGVAFGGPRADAIEAVAQTLRERASLGAQLRGFAAQARLSAIVISLAPLVFMSITVASDAASREVMLGSSAGRACLVVGVTLDGIGWWWMGRITAHAAGPTS